MSYAPDNALNYLQFSSGISGCYFSPASVETSRAAHAAVSDSQETVGGFDDASSLEMFSLGDTVTPLK